MAMITLLKNRNLNFLQAVLETGTCGYGLRGLERPRRRRRKFGVQEPTALCSSKKPEKDFPPARPERGARGEGRRWGGPQSGGPSWWSWQMTLSPLQMLPSRPPHEEQGQ